LLALHLSASSFARSLLLFARSLRLPLPTCGKEVYPFVLFLLFDRVCTTSPFRFGVVFQLLFL